MNFILDTHVFLWWMDDNASLSQKARDVLSDPSKNIYVSAASAWEISIKQSLGKLKAPDNLKEAIEKSGFSLLSITIDHAILAGRLPPYHEDPFDRLLVAQATLENLILITRDRKQVLYPIECLKA